jgi:nicotinamide phosphoribosyltransferase
VIRPDSGDPVKIICGDPDGETEVERKGVVELLWDVFGGTVTEKGFKLLDAHIGAIYGDSINIDRATRICEGLKAKGFATQVVFGIGSYTYQYNTRDTFGTAMKATYVVIDGEGQEIYKDPVTDDGTKRSATGLLNVKKENGRFVLYDKVTWEQERESELKTVFKDGKLMKEFSLKEIRALLSD